MKRTVMTMIAGLACIATAFAQMSEGRVPAKGYLSQRLARCLGRTAGTRIICSISDGSGA